MVRGGGPANIRAARRVSSPHAFRTLPLWALAGQRAPAAVDARIYNDVIWILRRYHLRVTAVERAVSGAGEVAGLRRSSGRAADPPALLGAVP
jgi:hypothetical protein